MRAIAASSAASLAAWTRASGVSGSTAAPRPIRLSSPTAWSMASDGAAAAAAELDDGEAEAAGVDAGDEAGAAGGDVDDQRGAGEVVLEAVEEVGRAADRQQHELEHVLAALDDEQGSQPQHDPPDRLGDEPGLDHNHRRTRGESVADPAAGVHEAGSSTRGQRLGWTLNRIGRGSL